MHNEECLGRGREGEVYLTKNQQGKKIVVKRYNSECKISEDLEQYYNSAKEYRVPYSVGLEM